MNWDNWLDPKNSLIAAETGLALIKSCGPKSSASAVVNLSLTALSTRIKPILYWFETISPTDLTRLLPKWSMSSTCSLPFLIATRVFNESTMSSLSRTLFPSIEGLPNLLLNFILPTSDRSYLSGLKNRLWNKVVAASFVGGSPGLIIL